jgi:histidinol-phosphate aminotransferase
MTGSHTQTKVAFPSQLLQASAYVPEWLGVDRWQFLRLDRNENTRPIPAHVAETLVQHLTTHGVHAYPETSRLVPPLANYCGVPQECVIPTNGADQGIDLTLRSFLGKASRMLVARPEFSIFSHIASIIGAQVSAVPYYRSLDFPYHEFREAAAEAQPELIVVINPNNPTGTAVRLEFIEELAATHPRVPVVVDEVYYEYTGKTAIPLVQSHENVVVLRTFSKAFSMAGLRLGYIVAAPPVAMQIAKLRNPFDINELAIVAGAAQLRDLTPMQAHVDEVVTRSKPAIVDFFEEKGIPVFPGSANFVLVKPKRSSEAVDFLFRRGILVRSMTAQLLNGMLRISLGSLQEMERFIEVFREFLEEGSQ